MAKRTRRGRPQFLVRWQGFGPEHDTWEDERNIFDQSLIEEFHASLEPADVPSPLAEMPLAIL